MLTLNAPSTVIDPPIQEPATASVSIIVPTYREVENLPLLIERIGRLRTVGGLNIELLLMDDDSRDGSRELVQSLGLPWVGLVTRTRDRGLSQAVVDGLHRARHSILIVMDADLSHPPESIPRMIHVLSEGADLVVGSRFVDGGSTDDEWGVFRWLNSRIATALARPLTSIRDPMSGFFAISRRKFEQADTLNPIGYKIGLEIIVKCQCKRIREIPIHFQDRRHGTSKLCLAEQLRYLRHVCGLYAYRLRNWPVLSRFPYLGALGINLNLLLLTIFLMIPLPVLLAVGLSSVLSMLGSFWASRWISSDQQRADSLLRQAGGFLKAHASTAIVSLLVAVCILYRFPHMESPQFAALGGIVAGIGFNYIQSRYQVFANKCFGRTHIRY